MLTFKARRDLAPACLSDVWLSPETLAFLPQGLCTWCSCTEHTCSRCVQLLLAVWFSALSDPQHKIAPVILHPIVFFNHCWAFHYLTLSSFLVIYYLHYLQCPSSSLPPGGRGLPSCLLWKTWSQQWHLACVRHHVSIFGMNWSNISFQGT